ncbi:hypothetical protein TorRG33x02_311540 [Trema orientale]|uniref:Uncharacterized protein n=1 Tax=Trema orientale TaxID=63057 RepID=A0A2P5BRG3_TREOI|nr:hypothetical protein TorRG33x02_311540 [Trema orientale]
MAMAEELELGFRMSKAKARSGVIRVWDKGMSSSGEGSSSSHLENQLESSSLIVRSSPRIWANHPIHFLFVIIFDTKLRDLSGKDNYENSNNNYDEKKKNQKGR